MRTYRLRHLAKVNPPTSAFDRLAPDDEVTFLPMESVWPGARLDMSQRRGKSAVVTGYTRFQDGDVLVPKITPTFEAGRAVLINGLNKGVGTGTTELHVLRAGPKIEGRFLLYLVNTHSFLKLGEACMYGVAGQQRVPDSFLRDLKVNLPSLEEQRRIADFLDAETARIDMLSGLKARQGAVLRERFNAQLVHTMIPGTSPMGWNESRLKFLFTSNRNGVWGDEPTGDEHDVVCVRVADFQRSRFRADPNPSTTRNVPDAKKRLLQPGDVLLEKSGGGEKSPVGYAVMFNGTAPSVCSNFVAALRPSEDVDSRFAALLLAAFYLSGKNLAYIKQTTGIQNLDGEEYLNQRCMVPVKRKQQEIAKDLDVALDVVLTAESTLSRQVKLLGERRQALITAAVTGHIDVSTASRRGIEEGLS